MIASFVSLLCTAPGVELETLMSYVCERVGEHRKIIFQRIKDGSTPNSMTIADAALQATWEALFAANDGTKTAITPTIADQQTTESTKREGNFPIGGVPANLGRTPTGYACKILDSKQLLFEQLKNYETESKVENLGCYIVDEYSRIAGLTDSASTPVNFLPIPIQSFFVGDKVFGGYEGHDYNQLNWMFFPNWSDKFHLVTPESGFNPLTDLTNAAT